MLERGWLMGALLAGALLAAAIFTAGSREPRTAAEAWLERRGRAPRGVLRVPRPQMPPSVAAWLRLRIERAGWNETPERFAVLATAFPVSVGLLGAVLGTLAGAQASAVLGVMGMLAGAALGAHALRGAIRARRRRLLAELAPTLELMTLELGGGAGALAALAAVTRRTDGELARELRLLLAASAIGGSVSFDAGLRQLGERLDLPPLTALAAVIATSRDYGSGVAHGVQAISADLRRAQRRELIETSRRALSRVVVPSALGVLLPFMAVLLFPAVTMLGATFR